MTADLRKLLDDLDAAEKAAHAEVVRLCEGGRWTMRVPADEARDSDTVIEAALVSVPRLTAAVRAVLDLAADYDDGEGWGEALYHGRVVREQILATVAAALDEPTP